MCIRDRLYQKGLLVGTDGNFSIRLNEKEIVITASGFCKGKLQESSFTVVSPDGEVLSGSKPARDIRMHLAVYRQRPDVTAVVHAHPPVATGLSMTSGIEPVSYTHLDVYKRQRYSFQWSIQV